MIKVVFVMVVALVVALFSAEAGECEPEEEEAVELNDRYPEI